MRASDSTLQREVVAWRALATINALHTTKANMDRVRTGIRRNAFGLDAVDPKEFDALVLEAQNLAAAAKWVVG